MGPSEVMIHRFMRDLDPQSATLTVITQEGMKNRCKVPTGLDIPHTYMTYCSHTKFSQYGIVVHRNIHYPSIIL